MIQKLKNYTLSNKEVTILEYLLIIISSIVPIFLTFHYVPNLYLSWEGAYRLYLGQVPFKDFGLPLGFGLWIIPAIFFKLFGPYLATLIKAQALINILSALSFRFILKQLKVIPEIRILCVLLFIISFSSFNVWPWYNHTDIVFEFIGLAFLLQYISGEKRKYSFISLFLSTLFLFLSFFTKQDAGGLAFVIGLVLIAYHSLYLKKIKPLLLFLAFYLFIGMCFILPFIPHHFGYWFDFGQPPHNARLSFYDMFDAFFSDSQWIKFYLAVILLIILIRHKQFKGTKAYKTFILFSILVLGILGEAAVIQVTSFTNSLNNIFFHSFAIAYILAYSGLQKNLSLKNIGTLSFIGILLIIWWSPIVWGHAGKVIEVVFPNRNVIDTNVITQQTFKRPDPHWNWDVSQTPNPSKWEQAPWEAFKGFNMPRPTIEGIKRLLDRDEVKNMGKELKVLNMSEITPLALVIGYTPETGNNIPLWYHKGVGLFEQQIQEYEKKIKENYYDLVLFEDIPRLNNFFPFEIQTFLKNHYQQIDSFPAPGMGYYRNIEVYVKRK